MASFALSTQKNCNILYSDDVLFYLRMNDDFQLCLFSLELLSLRWISLATILLIVPNQTRVKGGGGGGAAAAAANPPGMNVKQAMVRRSRLFAMLPWLGGVTFSLLGTVFSLAYHSGKQMDKKHYALGSLIPRTTDATLAGEPER